MAGISNYIADIVDDWLHGGTAYTVPGTTYFALMLVMPTASGGGTEVTATGYSRLAVTNNSTNWPASSSGIKKNGTTMTWATPSANMGTVIGYAEYDAATNGNLLTFANFSNSVLILSGQSFSLPVGAGVFSWSGDISNYLTDKLNDWLHGGGAFSVPSPTYFGLMTTSPTQTTTGAETTGGAYARVSYTNNLTDWPASAGQTKSNANALNWPTALTNWASPEVAVAEFDAASGGNILTFGPLAASVTVNTGATPQIAANGAVYSVS